jgi:hypothetical protein
MRNFLGRLGVQLPLGGVMVLGVAPAVAIVIRALALGLQLNFDILSKDSGTKPTLAIALRPIELRFAVTHHE